MSLSEVNVLNGPWNDRHEQDREAFKALSREIIANTYIYMARRTDPVAFLKDLWTLSVKIVDNYEKAIATRDRIAKRDIGYRIVEQEWTIDKFLLP
jgi:hypothetical protein